MTTTTNEHEMRPVECDCCGGTWGYINAQTDEHDSTYDCITELTKQRNEWRDAAKWSEGQHQHWKTVAEAATAQRDAAVRDVQVVREIRARRNVVVEASPELLTNGAFTDKPLHVMLNDNGDGTHLLTFRASDTIRELRQQLDASRLFSDEAVRAHTECYRRLRKATVRLAACERVVEAAEQCSGKRLDMGLMKALANLDEALIQYRSAVAAETQTTPHAGGTDA